MGHKGRRHRPGAPRSMHEPYLTRATQEALKFGHPLALLVETSEMVELATPRTPDLLRPNDDNVSTQELVETLLLIDERESTALLHAIRALLRETPIVPAIDDELDRRHWRLPGWVRKIDQIEIVGTAFVPDILGDGDSFLVSMRWPGVELMTVSAFVDHNIGGLLVEAFPQARGLDECAADLRSTPGREVQVEAIDPADVRARIEQAIVAGDRQYPPLETESWPGTRPLLEWVISHLPEGGRGYDRPEWTPHDRHALTTAFLNSTWGRPLREEGDAPDVVNTLITFACDYGSGDPLRWSPTSVEIFLANWFPTKVIADAEYRAGVPSALRAFIGYCHAERAMPEHLTEATVTAVDDWGHHAVEGLPAPPEVEALDKKPSADTQQRAELAFAWFPADQWGEARALFELEKMPLDHAEYSKVLQNKLAAFIKAPGTQLSVAPLNIEEMIAHARSKDIDPMSDNARSAMAAEMARTDRTIPWPPGRNDPCWCGSGRKHKHCCLRNG